MTNKTSICLLSALLSLALASQAGAWWPDERGPDHQRRPFNGPGIGRGMEPGSTPFGGYCPKRHADQYGARQPVLTPADARERLSLFFSIDPARIRRLEERRHVFLAEITDPEGRPVELVIIDRRTGRIRSIR